VFELLYYEFIRESEIMKTKKSSFVAVLVALAMAQFIMTVDTTIMNIAIPSVVEDLDTDVGSVQSAITLYALTMAAFMLIGAKLGEIYGRKKIFRVGLVIYAIGSAITALAPSIAVLIVGWSLLEGIGASLMMPAMMALIGVNFTGKSRVTALGVVAGVAGAAAAVGPLIGGALSTYSTWRWAFVAEVVIALITLAMSVYIKDNAEKAKEKIDLTGGVLAAGGLGLFVFGILQSSEYGWIRATKPFEIGDSSFNLFGISVVVYLCALGIALLYGFYKYELNREKLSKPVILRVSLLRSRILSSGLNIVLITQLIMGGFMFVLPLFLQLVLGYSAIQSGLALMPLSITLILASFQSGKLADKWSPINVIRGAQVLVVIGLIILLSSISNNTQSNELVVPMIFVGAGLGLIFPLLQSIVLGSVSNKDTSQASGLNYTYQQLGMSLGTAVIGSVLLFSLGNGFVSGLKSSDSFDTQAVEAQSVQISQNAEFVSNDQLDQALVNSGLSDEQKQDIIVINEESRIRALKVSLAVAALFSIVGISSSARLRDHLEARE
jgi:EmrB/QacA subfamily drug resistance transporter